MAYTIQQAPFEDPGVHRALNMAIDKQAIIDVIFQSYGEISKSPIPRPCSPKAVEDYPYDPETARQMLADAGVEDLSMRIWAVPVQRPATQTPAAWPS